MRRGPRKESVERKAIPADQQAALGLEGRGKGRGAGLSQFWISSSTSTAPDLPASAASKRAPSYCCAIHACLRDVGSSALAKRATRGEASMTCCTSVVLPTCRGPATAWNF
jgi:hypothetical protein